MRPLYRQIYNTIKQCGELFFAPPTSPRLIDPMTVDGEIKRDEGILAIHHSQLIGGLEKPGYLVIEGKEEDYWEKRKQHEVRQMDPNARLRPEKKTSWFPGTLFFFFPPPPSGARERPFLLHHLVVRREWRETLGTKLFQSHVSERGNFVSKTELKTYIGHRKECKCVTFKCLDFTFFTVANLRFQLSY